MRLPPGLGLPCATGLYLAPKELVLAQVRFGPRGRRLGLTARAPLDASSLGATLAQWKSEGKLRGRILCGVDPRRLYAVTRGVQGHESKSAPAEKLAAALGLGEEALLAEGAPVRLPGGAHIALVGCRREQVGTLHTELLALKLSAARLLPVHWALALEARRAGPRPRRWRADIRVLPGGSLSLALLSWQGFPIAFRPLDLQGTDPSHAIELAVLSLRTHAREELGLQGVDGVILHLGDEGAELAAEAEKCHGLPQKLGARFELSEERCAEALARLALGRAHMDADMFAAMQPAAGWRENLPVRTAAALLLALGASAWMLSSEASKLEHETAGLLTQAEGNCKKARSNLKDLKKLHEKLSAEVGIAHAFLSERVWVSEAMQHVPEVVPVTMQLADLDLKDYVPWPSKKTSTSKVSKRLVSLVGEVPLAADSSSPPEVAEMTELLEQSGYFHAHFPKVTGANVRLMPSVKGLSARISMTLLPAAKGG
jgi:hypothetical protein